MIIAIVALANPFSAKTRLAAALMAWRVASPFVGTALKMASSVTAGIAGLSSRFRALRS
ncbi:hypothetical protein WKW80_21065 [Variovorax humicola]|uniref:Uncharacterized protein n=1 Tax=Variovorax humicola TaxID=1769758 RepID=A0ABU8W545_9BURK